MHVRIVFRRQIFWRSNGVLHTLILHLLRVFLERIQTLCERARRTVQLTSFCFFA